MYNLKRRDNCWSYSNHCST